MSKEDVEDYAKLAIKSAIDNSKVGKLVNAGKNFVKNGFKSNDKKKKEKTKRAEDEKDMIESTKDFMSDNPVGTTFVDSAGSVHEKPMPEKPMANADEATEIYPDTGYSKEANEVLTIPKQNNFQIGNKVAEDTDTTEKVVEEAEKAVEESDVPEEVEKKAKNKYAKATKSIWQAYLDGDFGEGEEAERTRNYFILDAVSTFMKNTGNNIRDVAAIYGGGSPSNAEPEKDKWSTLQDEAFANEAEADISSEEGTAANLDKRMKELEVMSKELDVQNKPEIIKAQIENLGIMNQLRAIDLSNAQQRSQMADEMFAKADNANGVAKYVYQALGVYLMSGNPIRDATSLIGGALNMAL